MLAPRGHGDGACIAIVVHERCPYGKSTWVVLLFLGERTVERRHDVVSLGKLRRDGVHFPMTPVIALEQSAAARLRPLLILTGEHMLTEQATHHDGLGIEPLRPETLPLHSARIGPERHPISLCPQPAADILTWQVRGAAPIRLEF